MEVTRRKFVAYTCATVSAHAFPNTSFGTLPECENLRLSQHEWIGEATTKGYIINHCSNPKHPDSKCGVNTKLLGIAKEANIAMFANKTFGSVVARTKPLAFQLEYRAPDQQHSYLAVVSNVLLPGLTYKGHVFGTEQIGEKKKKYVITANGQPVSRKEMTLVIFTEGEKKLYAKYSLSTPSIRAILTEADIQNLLSANAFYVMVTYQGSFLMIRKYHTLGLDKLVQKLYSHTVSEKKKADNKVCFEGGCFLTTAACVAIARADDCWELRSLRRFRDGHLAQTEPGQEDIRYYYKVAPLIVSAIGRDSNAKQLFKSMYWFRVIPYALLIRFGFKQTVHRLYKSWIFSLEQKYL